MRVEPTWQQEEANLAASVPGGSVQVVSSGHSIQTLHPEAVIAAIKSEIAAVTTP